MKKIIILVMVVIILCSCSRLNERDQSEQSNQSEQFDQQLWLNEPEQRESLVRSLTNNYQLKGMTEEEIIDLLGEPDQIISESSKQYLFFIGYGGFVGINVSLLQLQFDANGKVESHSVIHK